MLNPGTPNPNSSAPETVEQNATLARISSPNGILDIWAGQILLPDGTFGHLSDLVIPAGRETEINSVLNAGPNGSPPSPGYILILNVDGVPVDYIKLIFPIVLTPTPIPQVVIRPAYITEVGLPGDNGYPRPSTLSEIQFARDSVGDSVFQATAASIIIPPFLTPPKYPLSADQNAQTIYLFLSAGGLPEGDGTVKAITSDVPVPTATPIPIPVPVTPINTLSLVTFSPDISTILTKAYTLRSLNNIINDVITITNISNSITVSIRFESLHPSIIVEDPFILTPGQFKNSTISYSSVQLESVVPFAGTFGSAVNIYVGVVNNV